MSSLTINSPSFLVPHRAQTLAGFRAWVRSADFPAHGRISFFSTGLHIDMSPEELETHSKVRMAVLYTLEGLNRKLELGDLHGDRILLTNPAAELSTEADAVLLTFEDMESGRVRLIPRTTAERQFIEVEGAPSWVLEIVSDSSVGKDTRVLRELYHRAGIREYWLIDARGDEITFEILTWTEAGYDTIAARRAWLRSPFFGRAFRLTRQRERLDLWQYTLDVRR